MATTDPAVRAPVDKGSFPEPRTVRKRRGPIQEGGSTSPLVGIAAWTIGLLFAAPVFWMFLTGLHSETDAATNPPSIAAALTLDGYRNFFGAATGASPWPPLINSLTASVVSTILVILLGLPAA